MVLGYRICSVSVSVKFTDDPALIGITKETRLFAKEESSVSLGFDCRRRIDDLLLRVCDFG